MATIRQRVTNFLLKDEIDKLGNAYDMLVEGYRRGPALLSTETLAANLQELDSQLLDLIIRQRGYDPLIGAGAYGFGEFSEADRLRAVNDSRHMYHYDVQTKRGTQLWTDFGFGQAFSVSPVNDIANAIWDEFVTAQRNSPLLKIRKIQNLSNTMLIDGEIFFVFYWSTVTGETTIRRFKTEEITQIIYANNDPDVPLFYVRNEQDGDQSSVSVYYPDWQAPEDLINSYVLPAGAIRADQRGDTLDFTDGNGGGIISQPLTKAVVLHAAFEEINGRGWPVFNNGLPWARTYKGFLQDRATVSKAVASMVDEIIHTGGSRVQSDLMASIASTLSQTMPYDNNAPPTAGSTGIHNQGIELKRRPLTTGAGDAQDDGIQFIGQLVASDGVPAMWRGRTDAAQNRAVARELERPWLEQMQRYQTFWTDIFRDMVIIVVRNANDSVTDYSSDVFMQSPYAAYPDEIAPAMSSLTSASTAGAIDPNVARVSNEIFAGLMLTTYGVDNVDEIFENAKFEGDNETSTEAQAILDVAKDAVQNFREGDVNPDGVIEWLYATLQEHVK